MDIYSCDKDADFLVIFPCSSCDDPAALQHPDSLHLSLRPGLHVGGGHDIGVLCPRGRDPARGPCHQSQVHGGGSPAYEPGDDLEHRTQVVAYEDDPGGTELGASRYLEVGDAA